MILERQPREASGAGFFCLVQNACSENHPRRSRRPLRRKHEMNTRSLNGIPAISALLAAVSMGAFALPAEAGEKMLFSREVDSCLAAVNSKLDLESATRVRHLVSKVKKTGIGYALTIESAVVFPDSEKRYETHCVANGNNAPIKLNIEPS
jgi:hypothetical protein